jgi:hypothetical protein
MFILLIGSVYLSSGVGISIIIDGNFSDWEGITPVFVDEEAHPDYWLDIQQGFVAANETTLFIRLDYNRSLDYWDSLLGNITIQTPANKTFILMYQIVYETEPHWSFSAIFPGINLSSFLNDPQNLTMVADYQDSVAIDPSTNRSVEYYFKLADLGLTIDDSVNMTFWHYEGVSAGEYSVLLHRKAGTVYRIALSGDRETTTEGDPTSSTSTTMTSSAETTTTDQITTFSILGFIVGIVTLNRKRRN